MGTRCSTKISYMKPLQRLETEFVEFIPIQVEDGKLYVSMPYATVVHNCCCGCGNKVVTPLTPTDWKLTYDGEAVSISPSIGNWSFPCQSHYWIKRGRIEWSGQWTPEEVASGRRRDKKSKQKYFAQSEQQTTAPTIEEASTSSLPVSWWTTFKLKIRSFLRL